jgi:hypothetical protein
VCLSNRMNSLTGAGDSRGTAVHNVRLQASRHHGKATAKNQARNTQSRTRKLPGQKRCQNAAHAKIHTDFSNTSSQKRVHHQTPIHTHTYMCVNSCCSPHQARVGHAPRQVLQQQRQADGASCVALKLEERSSAEQR